MNNSVFTLWTQRKKLPVARQWCKTSTCSIICLHRLCGCFFFGFWFLLWNSIKAKTVRVEWEDVAGGCDLGRYSSLFLKSPPERCKASLESPRTMAVDTTSQHREDCGVWQGVAIYNHSTQEKCPILLGAPYLRALSIFFCVGGRWCYRNAPHTREATHTHST